MDGEVEMCFLPQRLPPQAVFGTVAFILISAPLKRVRQSISVAQVFGLVFFMLKGPLQIGS